MLFRARSLVLFLLLLTLPLFSLAAPIPLWHCTAKSDQGAYWYRYGKTQSEAQFGAEKLCHEASHRSCVVICMPPRIYYRCIAYDTPSNPTQKKGIWYWSSYSNMVAINGALDACRHNSQVGGCYVDPTMCASS